MPGFYKNRNSFAHCGKRCDVETFVASLIEFNEEKTMTALNPRAHLRGTTESAHSRLVNDLKALEEDKANVTPGGVTRPPLNSSWSVVAST